MLQSEIVRPEIIRDDAAWWLRRDIPDHKKIEIFKLLTKALTIPQISAHLQRDIVEKLLEIMPGAGKLNPVETLEALSDSFLWISTDYIHMVSKGVVLLENPAIQANPNLTLAALEKILLVCHCAIIPLKINGPADKPNESCLELQRQAFFTILNAIENIPTINPDVCTNVLRISGVITEMNDKMSDINKKIHDVTHKHGLASSSWH
jgi:hypothetical protein